MFNVVLITCPKSNLLGGDSSIVNVLNPGEVEKRIMHFEVPLLSYSRERDTSEAGVAIQHFPQCIKCRNRIHSSAALLNGN
jgi:hypothetical protein